MQTKRAAFYSLLGLAILIILSTIYLFGKEDLQTVYNNLTGFRPVTQEPGPTTQKTLYESILSDPIDWTNQMAKLQEEGFANNPFIADITAVDRQGRLLTLQMDFNYGGEFPQIQEVVAKVSCPVESTYVLSQTDLRVLAENPDVFSFARPGDILMSYCQNDTCSEIGKECIAVIINNEVIE